MMEYRYFLGVLLLLLMVSCDENGPSPLTGTLPEVPEDSTEVDFCAEGKRFTEVDFFAREEIDSLTDVVYGKAVDWKGNTVELHIDAYFHKVSIDKLSRRPAVLLIHGGSYQIGRKEQWADECIGLAKKGFVAFTIQYRLGWNEDTPVDQVRAAYRANQDARAALRYVVNNAERYGIATDGLFIGGGSAGANCALNTVYTTQEEWNGFFPGIEDKLGGLHTSGNTLTDAYVLRGVANHWGSVRESYVQANEMLPMISFHGALDATVAIDRTVTGSVGSRALSTQLKENGVCTDLTVKPNGGHGVYLDPSGTAFRVGRMSCFFKSILCNSCTDFSAEERVEADCGKE